MKHFIKIGIRVNWAQVQILVFVAENNNYFTQDVTESYINLYPSVGR